jgi:6-phosphogluconolactonase
MTRFLLGSVNKPNPWFRAAGEGVTVGELDETTGIIRRVSSHPDIENAMWMVRVRDGIIVATERNGGEVGAFDFELNRIGMARDTLGSAICHLAVSTDEQTLFAVSYLGGVTIHALSTDGAIAAAHREITYIGSGPNETRQEKSHPHQAVVSPDGKYLFVCDLGSDMVWVHPIEGNNLGPATANEVAAGSGPRHLVFHPTLPRLYLLGELDGMVHTYAGRGAEWTLIASYSAVPNNFVGAPAAGAIRLHPSGKTLATSERGSNSITVFRIEANGDLATAANFSTGGDCPRDFDFTPSGKRLLALNQNSDNVIAFGFDAETGLPNGSAGESFVAGCPVCVTF